MKTPAEKLQLCKVCKNHKFDLSRGIVCKLTNEKPTFEEECPDHVADEVLVRQQQRFEEQTKDDNEELDGKMPGSNWFLWIAGLSILNIGLLFIGWRFFFGLGATQIFQELMLAGSIPVALGVVCILMLPAFFVWTWWATSKKGIKLFYKLGWAIYLVDALIYLTLCALTLCSSEIVNSGYYAFILIIDIVLHVAVLIFGFKLSELKKINGSKATSGHKIGYISYIIVTLLVSLSALVYAAANELIKDPTANIEYTIQTIQAELPTKIDEFTTLEKVAKSDLTIRYTYSLTNANAESVTPDELQSYSESAKQQILNNITKASPFEILCWEQGYTNLYEYRANSKVLFNITITPEEYKTAVNK